MEMSANRFALRTQNLTKAFGGLRAVDECSFDLEEGVIAGLIGPNGAGKTTLFNMLSGLLAPDSGKIFFKGQEITRLPAHKRAALGIGRTFQITHALRKMKVLDNLKLAAQSQLGENIANVWLRPRAVREQERKIEERALEMLKFLNLYELRDEYAGNLSGGQKKLLEIGRMLMLEPCLILMDEPFAGVNPVLAEEIGERIRKLRERGITILVIEHNIKRILRLSDVVYVMSEGKIIAQGDPESIRRDERVIEAYLGSGR
ncbi:MAG: ABC transporter ATP-binding protein [Chloroflexi bacterium]|nr:MAG: ABC transporter ATP-binding protein [Chloroflexota bacterium]